MAESKTETLKGVAVSRLPASRDGAWHLFGSAQDVFIARSTKEVVAVLEAVEEAAMAGRIAVGFVAYEAAPALDRAFPSRGEPVEVPLAWFSVFGNGEEVAKPLLSCHGSPAEWRCTLSKDEYLRKLGRIKTYLKAGDVYQVNFTKRLLAEGVHPERLFTLMYNAQPTDFATFLNAGDLVICSVSPELFFDLRGNCIISKPMKGTCRRGRTNSEDKQNARFLQTSSKERAENLMIVDMVRNDLGRIAVPGSVEVSNLFNVKRYNTVFQMTSTVRGKTNAPLVDIFRALFPPASVTGAPKIRATQIINELENEPRGVYTGCIGVVGPGRRARFAVAIRTAVVNRDSGSAEYGVGGGITVDSDDESEYEECHTKALVLSPPALEFSLLETIRWSRAEGYFLLDRHLARLADSARYFGFHINLHCIEQLLHEEAREFAERPMKVRLFVAKDGSAKCGVERLDRPEGVVKVGLARKPIDKSDVFLYHKTTNRRQYEEAKRDFPGYADVILYNESGEVTESTIANIVVEKDGRLVTPPAECGLLAGTFRGHLLEKGVISEERVLVEDLFKAGSVFLVNSVRGWVRAAVER